MGTLYYVGCYDCMVYRDLDKFSDSLREVNNHKEAKEFATKLERGAFRAALLVSFMGKHKGHKCTVFSEHDFEYYDFDPDYDDKNVDYDFWQTVEKVDLNDPLPHHNCRCVVELKAPLTSDHT